MIGNDVVDLQLAATESNWKRKGFLDKVFTAAEQTTIADSPDPATTVWMLWSIKEAAYKIYNRQTGEQAFMPLRLEASIQPYSGGVGNVSCGGVVYYTRTILDDGLLHTVAVTDPEYFAAVSEAGYDAITKDARGLPHINGKPASVSHHGKGMKVVFLSE